MPDEVEIASTDEANTTRQQLNEKAVDVAEAELEEWAGTPEADDDLEEQIIAELNGGDDPEASIVSVRRQRGRTRQSSLRPDRGRELWIRRSKKGAKHRYLSRDPDAGFRIYKISERKIKVIYGFLKMRLTDDYTGAEIVSLHIPADQQEYKHLPELLARFRELLGFYPEVVCGDKGYTIRETKLWCASRGVGLISPYRPPLGQVKDRSEPLRVSCRLFGLSFGLSA